MGKIYCADLRCKYRDDKTGLCKAKEINLSSNSIMTLYEGRREFNTCKTMEESEQYKELTNQFKKYFGVK